VVFFSFEFLVRNGFIFLSCITGCLWMLNLILLLKLLILLCCWGGFYVLLLSKWWTLWLCSSICFSIVKSQLEVWCLVFSFSSLNCYRISFNLVDIFGFVLHYLLSLYWSVGSEFYFTWMMWKVYRSLWVYLFPEIFKCYLLIHWLSMTKGPYGIYIYIYIYKKEISGFLIALCLFNFFKQFL